MEFVLLGTDIKKLKIHFNFIEDNEKNGMPIFLCC